MSEREPGSTSVSPEVRGEHAGSRTTDVDSMTVGDIVVSLQLPEDLLNRIQAVAAVEGKSPNDVLRDGLTKMIPEWVNTPEFRRMIEVYLAEHGQPHPGVIRTLGAVTVSRHLDGGIIGDGSSLNDIS